MRTDPAYVGDFSLIILDIAQNSVKAAANCIAVTIEESAFEYRLCVRDNGIGIDEKIISEKMSGNPDTKEITGQGLFNLRKISSASDGEMTICSKPGDTVVTASFKKSSPNCPKLGEIARSIAVLFYLNPNLEISFCHVRGEQRISLCSQDILKLPLRCAERQYKIIEYIEQYLNKEYQIFGGSQI